MWRQGVKIFYHTDFVISIKFIIFLIYEKEKILKNP